MQASPSTSDTAATAPVTLAAADVAEATQNVTAATLTATNQNISAPTNASSPDNSTSSHHHLEDIKDKLQEVLLQAGLLWAALHALQCRCMEAGRTHACSPVQGLETARGV